MLNVAAVFEYSKRGSKKLVLNGIKYRYKGMNGYKIWWRCATHEKWGCKAVVHTIDDVIVRYINEHIINDVAVYEYNKRGSKILVVNGIKFRIKGKNGCKVRWRCASHEKWSCRAVVHTIDDVIVWYINKHTIGLQESCQ
uniref:SFRICE_018333 n=1 Tax=Spodoptera frugiperda TaxID=7108 RepID=A0A2H1WKY4_SPOFR